MFKTVRTLHSFLSLSRKPFYSRRSLNTMANLLKKPVKLALIQLASGSSLRPPYLSVSMLRALPQVLTRTRTFRMPETRSLKQPLLAQTLSSSLNASTVFTVATSSPLMPRLSSHHLLRRSSPHLSMLSLPWLLNLKHTWWVEVYQS